MRTPPIPDPPHPRTRLLSLVLLLVAAFATGAASAATLRAEAAPEASGEPVVVAPADGAPASLPIECAAERDLCDLAEEVALDLRFPWVTTGYSLRISPAPDEWLAGVSRHDQQVIELYVRPDSTHVSLARTLAHEVAHGVHTSCEGRLDEWRDRRGLPDTVPDHVPAPHEYDSVAEDFAEAFTQYLRYGESRSTVGEPVDGEWLQRNADLFVPCPQPSS